MIDIKENNREKFTKFTKREYDTVCKLLNSRGYVGRSTYFFKSSKVTGLGKKLILRRKFYIYFAGAGNQFELDILSDTAIDTLELSKDVVKLYDYFKRVFSKFFGTHFRHLLVKDALQYTVDIEGIDDVRDILDFSDEQLSSAIAKMPKGVSRGAKKL